MQVTLVDVNCPVDDISGNNPHYQQTYRSTDNDENEDVEFIAYDTFLE
jgi:hypothetical protein